MSRRTAKFPGSVRGFRGFRVQAVGGFGFRV